MNIKGEYYKCLYLLNNNDIVSACVFVCMYVWAWCTSKYALRQNFQMQFRNSWRMPIPPDRN